ncbi:MAG: uroporphyrinogen-III synthase [Pseudomonadota bacterium]|jgi:uroporphyrinogen-III synthase
MLFMPMACSDWRIWATRPEAQNSAWAARLKELGFAVFELPLLAISPLEDADSQQAIKSLVLDFDQFDKVIFVSQNAVQHAFHWLHDYWPQLPAGIGYFAVGEKTAQTLTAEGINSQVAAGQTSEALLALPALNEVWGQKILICRGRGGLPKLGECLHQRGALVRYLELYERLLPPQAEQQLHQQLPSLPARDLLVAFSGETLHNLVRLFQAHPSAPFANPLLVPGKRVEELAYQLGFQQVICAANASEPAMLDSLLGFTGNQ